MDKDEYFAGQVKRAKDIADKLPVEDKDGWAKEIFQKLARHEYYLDKL